MCEQHERLEEVVTSRFPAKVIEDYPSTRYGIDAVALWPRILPTLETVEGKIWHV